MPQLLFWKFPYERGLSVITWGLRTFPSSLLYFTDLSCLCPLCISRPTELGWSWTLASPAATNFKAYLSHNNDALGQDVFRQPRGCDSGQLTSHLTLQSWAAMRPGAFLMLLRPAEDGQDFEARPGRMEGQLCWTAFGSVLWSSGSRYEREQDVW